jgi:hypothetical protein
MNCFGEKLKFMAMRTGSPQQVCGSGIAREEQNLAFWQSTTSDDRRLNARHTSFGNSAFSVAMELSPLETVPSREDWMFTKAFRASGVIPTLKQTQL